MERRWQVRPTEGATGVTKGDYRRGKMSWQLRTEMLHTEQTLKTGILLQHFIVQVIQWKKWKQKKKRRKSKMMKDNRYSMLHDFAVDVRPVKIRHFTVGWPIAVRWGPKQLEVRTRKLLALSFIFYVPAPPPHAPPPRQSLVMGSSPLKWAL